MRPRRVIGICVAAALLAPVGEAGARGPTHVPWVAPGDSVAAGNSRVWLDTVPIGAEVRRGEQWVGRTPLWIGEDPDTDLPLTVSAPGYRTVRVRNLPREGVLDLRLEPQHARPPSGWGPRENRRSVRAGLFLLGAGSAVLGLHYKDTADEAFEVYTRTGNRDRMREAFERAETYDRYTLACWAVAEASLLGLLYLLMHSPEADTWEVRAEDGSPGSGRWTVRPALDAREETCSIGVRVRF